MNNEGRFIDLFSCILGNDFIAQLQERFLKLQKYTYIFDDNSLINTAIRRVK